ncbi:MAG: hypothetical protein JW779_13400 [Candidatus Thorarchaeota archaeon]|nr:hypothetical protein [Candidatus Thorarchaeota archaeon]
MIPETDIQKLAIESRQRLIQEFAETYANLRERVRRVPDNDALNVSKQLSCPLEVAMVAYLINMDGIMGLRQAVDLFTTELERRANIGEDVPNLPGNVMEFALIEGRWISHIYGRFARQLELHSRSLSNLEDVVDFNDIEVEKALSIVAERTKLAETYILPIIEEWQKEHIKSTSADIISSFGPAITKWNQKTINGKFKQVIRRTQAHFRLIREVLTKSSDSFTIDASITRLDRLIDELNQPLDSLTLQAVAHFLVHIVPRSSTGRGDRSPFVDVGVSSTRGNKAEPDLSSPFDFLERDVKLGKRRTGEERETYLNERIGRVIRVLKYQGNDLADCIQKCLSELKDRFGLANVSIEDSFQSVRTQLIEAPVAERDQLANQLVHDFIDKHIYSEGATF